MNRWLNNVTLRRILAVLLLLALWRFAAQMAQPVLRAVAFRRRESAVLIVRRRGGLTASRGDVCRSDGLVAGLALGISAWFRRRADATDSNTPRPMGSGRNPGNAYSFQSPSKYHHFPRAHRDT